MKKLIYGLGLLIMTMSCNKSVASINTKQPEGNKETAKETIGNSPKIIDSLYVINVNDDVAEAYTSTEYDANSVVMSLGTKVYIIEKKTDWYTIWYKNLKSNTYSKLYIRPVNLAKPDKFLLSNADLPQIILSDDGQQPTEDNENKSITTTRDNAYEEVQQYATNINSNSLRLQLITKEEYLEKKKTSVDYIILDTLTYRKKNELLTLPCKEKEVIFADIKTDGKYEEYTYEGDFPEKNVYLLYCTIYDEGKYLFVDKTTGETTVYFDSFPIISPDKQNIACLNWNPYENLTGFTLYRDPKNRITLNLQFSKWLPDNRHKIFWGTDQCLYACIKTAKYLDQPFDEDLLQYIKITIPGLTNK